MPPLRGTGTGPEAEDPDFAGQYRLETPLGSGGMGVVHLARSASGLRLAVKVIHAEFAADDEFRARFRQEVAAARRVSGAFTAPVVDADPDAERPWMATLYIPGPTLAEQVKRNGPLSLAEVRRLAAGLAEALRDIHRAGVVHRDLKPGNVLLSEGGPKVIDFGISRPSDSALRTETGKLIGTPPFMAPEQFQRPRSVGPAADVFALGSVLVHAATGRGPFDSDSPYIVAYQVVHDEADLTGVPESLAPLIRACLAKDPENRPTPDAVMAMLRATAEQDGAEDGARARVPAQRRPSAVETGVAGTETPGTDTSGTDTAGTDTADGDGPGQNGADRGAGLEDPTHIRSSDVGPTDAADRMVAALWEEMRGARTTAATPSTPTGSGSAHGSTAPNGSADDGTTRDAAHSTTPPSAVRRWRARWVAVAAATAVLIGAGVAVAQRHTGVDEQRQARTRTTAASFHPWTASVTPGGSAKSEAGAPFCTYGKGALYCAARGVKAARINPATGRKVWSREAGGIGGDGADGSDIPPQTPVVCDGLVHVLSVASGVARLEAMDPASGAIRWSKNVSAYEGRVYHAGATVLLVPGDGTIRGLRGATGKERWRKRYEGRGEPVFSAFGTGRTGYGTAVSDDGSHTYVTAIDPATGRTRWQRTLTGNLTPAGTAADGRTLLLTSADLQQRTDAVVRYDPGARRESRTPLALALDSVTTGVNGDTVHLLAHGGTLMAVDTRRTDPDRAELWRMETSVSNASPIAETSDRLYFTAADGRLLAIDARRGVLAGATPARMNAENRGYAGAVPAPVVANGSITGAAPDGTLFAVDGDGPADW
ncbi:PQQ-binding-like beta-propeller repeat protein [Streptomyces sp. NPDC051776]|uniref:protein kinase domain-containing protein n=1 Tax=Streptomyces sp. NPDC051776 TaxID=3155414 RepID=UPI003426E5EA